MEQEAKEFSRLREDSHSTIDLVFTNDKNVVSGFTRSKNFRSRYSKFKLKFRFKSAVSSDGNNTHKMKNIDNINNPVFDNFNTIF